MLLRNVHDDAYPSKINQSVNMIGSAAYAPTESVICCYRGLGHVEPAPTHPCPNRTNLDPADPRVFEQDTHVFTSLSNTDV